MTILQDFADEGQNLNLKVAALSNVGESLPSSPIQLSMSLAPSRPLSIRNDVLQTGKSKIGLVWDESASLNGAPITEYRVLWKLRSESTFKLAKSGIETTEVVLTSLNGKLIVANEWYEFKVQARNRIGVGELSDPILIQARLTSDYTSGYLNEEVAESDEGLSAETERRITTWFVVLLVLLVVFDLTILLCYIYRREVYPDNQERRLQ